MRTPLAVLSALLLLTACRDEQAGPKPRTAALPPSAAAAPARLLDQPPADLTFRSGATWGGGAVRYLGSKVAPARPGQPFTVAHYFRAEAPPPAGYQFFVHVVDPASGQMLTNADHEPQGGALPLGKFPVGKVVEDVHQVALPQGVGSARLLLGFWAGDQRLAVDQPQAHEGSHRMLGPTLGGAAAPSLPEYRAPRASQPPTIDGVLDDAAWAAAPEVQLVGSFDGRPTRLTTRARLTWDDGHLYVAFDSEDPDVWGTFRQRDDPIYTQEAVEIFLDADGDGRTYNELQVSPHNVLFDASFVRRRSDLKTAMQWDSGATSAVKVRGTLDDDSEDQGWSVELKIPLSRLTSVPRTPPVKGDRWRFNLYRLESHGRQQVEGMAFSPLFVGDFHHLPRFGWLNFD